MGIHDHWLAAFGGFICGPSFTLADVPVGLVIDRWAFTPMDRSRLAHVTDYLEQLRAYPALCLLATTAVP